MSRLYDYLLTLEAASEDDLAGSGLCALYLNVVATGTCGVTTQGTVPCDGVVPGEEDQDGYDPAEGGCTGIVLPGLIASGEAVCAHAARVVLPVPECRALGPEWFPAVGEAVLSSPEVSGTVRTLVASVSALPPLFALALAGAAAGAGLPRPEAAGATGAVAELSLPGAWAILSASGLDRLADGQADLPVPRVEVCVCSLANPVVRRTPSSVVVRLLNRDSAVLSLLARTLAGELEDMDDRAAALLYGVSNLLTYVSDPESLDYGDQWTCAVATWFRGYGDCEDGAVLLHGLLLALGADTSRVVTVFGRVGAGNLG
ncbi:MAG: transglutaminase, partial [Desulfovibrio sp.]|nr:transglutaminase [Desulfovibrio sp.]